MFNEVPETKIELIVTIPLSEYRELISKATRFDILKMDIEENVYSSDWERKICNIPKKRYNTVTLDETEGEGEN